MKTDCKNKIIYCLLFFCSFFVKFFSSFNSPIFDYASIYSDNAIFYLMGKAILNGRVLYKEIFDHKTPYIYFFNAIAAFIDKNHIGLFLLDVIILFITLIFVYEVLLLLLNSEWFSIIGTVFICFLLNHSDISLGVCRTEGYAVMFMIISAYIFIRYFRQASETGSAEFKCMDMFIIGVCASLTLMTNIRASILYVPFAFSVAIYLFKNKKYKNIIMIFLSGFFGVLVVISPYIIYMLFTKSTEDAIYAIFTYNGLYKYLDAKSSFEYGLLSPLILWIKTFPLFNLSLLLVLLSLVLVEGSNYIKIPSIISLIICFLYTIATNRRSAYYKVSFVPFYISIVVFLYKNIIVKINKHNKKCGIGKNFITIVVVFLFFFVNLLVGYNRITKRYVYNKRIKEELCSIISKNYGDILNAKVLSTGMNPEVYTFLGTDLKFQFFIIPFIKYKYASRPYLEQFNYILKKEPDIIIHRPDATMDQYPKNMQEQIYYVLKNNYNYIGKVETNNDEENYFVFIKK